MNTLAQNKIVSYYEQCHNAYRDAWNLDHNLQLNLGLWKKGTKNLAQALKSLNLEVAAIAGLKEGHRVLDAGCGVGGTAISFARTYHCKVEGITITPHQVEKAKQNAKQAEVEQLTDFYLMDYHQTDFKDESFDLIIGIESICYADPKIDFLKEAYRLLKKGGKIVLAENLQAKESLTKEEHQSLYLNSFHGCAVNSLDTEQQYRENLNNLTFRNISCTDYSQLIRPSIKRLRRFYYPAYLYNKVHRWMGKPFSPIQEANTKMCYHLLSSLDRGLWKYGIISATK